MSRILVFLCLLAAGANAAQAAFDAADYRKLNTALVQDHVVPRYENFAKAAQQLSAVADEACGMPSPSTIATLKQAVLVAQDAWQSVQHIRFGPIERDLRAARIEFWPDVRDRTSRELAKVLLDADKSALAPEAFAKAHIVVQGFPALERLLFEPGATKRLVDGTVDAHFRCRLVQAIAANIAAIAEAVRNEWTVGDGSFAEAVANAGGDFSLYPKTEEATLALFKSMHAALEIVADHKLARPLGDSIDSARPKRAESWRSERSFENICRNLRAAQAMYLGEDGSGKNGFSRFVREVAKDAALDDLLRRAFAQTLATAGSVKLPLAKAVADPTERAKLQKLKTEAAALKTLLGRRLTAALAIPLGFNALDGD